MFPTDPQQSALATTDSRDSLLAWYLHTNQNHESYRGFCHLARLQRYHHIQHIDLYSQYLSVHPMYAQARGMRILPATRLPTRDYLRARGADHSLKMPTPEHGTT